MRAFSLFCLWLMLSGFTPNQQVVALNPQVRPDNASAGLPAVDDNWAVAGYPYAGGACAEWGHRVPCYLHQSTMRASTAYCTALDGLLFNVATGVLRQCAWNGALIEEARTNIALWSRDYTNAVWAKVNVTAALTATGADNIANSASLLTATAVNGTILQTITSASTQRALSVYVQRVTGSGAINISQDGIAWTALTSANCVLPGSGIASALITTGYVKCTLVTTQLNPVIGFQIAANGDAVNADFTGLEAGAFATSAIPTTTVSVTRPVDLVALTGAAQTVLAGNTFSVYQAFGILPASGSFPMAQSGTTTNVVFRNPTTTLYSTYASDSTLLQATSPTSVTATTTKAILGQTNAIGRSLVVNNGTLVSDVKAADLSSGTNALGARSGGGSVMNGYTTRVSLWRSQLPDATLKAMTIP